MPLTLPYRQIMSRLGYSDQTKVPAQQLDLLTKHIQSAFALISPKGVYTCLAIANNDGQIVTLEDNTQIACPGVAKMLKNCQEVWLAAASIGREISELTAKKFAAGDGAAASITDAVGSECADAAMNFLQTYAATQLKRSGRILSDCRFSPGYGNWPLTAQKNFFSWLNLEELGLTLNDSMLLIPEKSVTALAGLKSNP